jgi:hypothetical protein
VLLPCFSCTSAVLLPCFRCASAVLLLCFCFASACFSCAFVVLLLCFFCLAKALLLLLCLCYESMLRCGAFLSTQPRVMRASKHHAIKRPSRRGELGFGSLIFEMNSPKMQSTGKKFYGVEMFVLQVPAVHQLQTSVVKSQILPFCYLGLF